jgi:hypothetical protein
MSATAGCSAVPLHDSKSIVGAPNLGMERAELAFVELQPAREHLVRAVVLAQPVVNDRDRTE